MAKREFIVLLKILCLSLLLFFSEGSEFCIRSTETNSSNSCMNLLQCNYTAFDLQDINGHNISSGEVEIYLCSSEYSIPFEESMNFTNLVLATITGLPNRTRLNCHNKTTGLLFRNVSSIEIINITLNQCGFQINNIEGYTHFVTASVLITGSTNIHITDVTFQNCSGVGLALVNNQGHIEITDSTFDSNALLNPGGGLYIESSSSQNSIYKIDNCIFQNNSVKYTLKENRTNREQSDFMRGGGININLSNATQNIAMIIQKCVFKNNSALNGGALDILFQGSVHNVTVIVNQSQFTNNTVVDKGGAVVAKYIHGTDNNNYMTGNKVQFNSCNFTGNSADGGGGIYIYAAPCTEENSNKFEFRNCNWTENTALYGAAVLMIPLYTSMQFYEDGILPTPLFSDCIFFKNNNKNARLESESSNYLVLQYGKGILFANTFDVLFQDKVQFIDNDYSSAVYLISSTLKILSSTSVQFTRNLGNNGGAINLQGTSSIYVNDDVSVTFENNSALEKGGAIFHKALIDPSHLSSTNCFMKYAGGKINNVSERNITINFNNNTVSQTQKAQPVFLFSSEPCQKIYHRKNDEILNTIAVFNFEVGIDNNTILTFASNFLVKGNLPRSLIAGKEAELNISVTDDSHVEVKPSVLIIQLRNINGSITLDPAYTIITNNRIKMLGTAKSNGRVKLVLLNQQDMVLAFNITLEYCPPGYVYIQTRKACVCSANTDKQNFYLGIHRCNLTEFRAHLTFGFWAGYADVNNATEDSFRTSNCPLGYCTNQLADYKSEIVLPPSASHEHLTKVICNRNREGGICALCKNNTSVFYHTQKTFNCENDKHCRLGILLFIISEILPVTILFLVVIFFDIQLTTGAVNGFLFYMQIFNTLSINANNFIRFPKVTANLLIILESIVRMFDLKFFLLPQLSFCLFKGANSLHVLVFNYITVAYSLLLIIFTVILMNTRCNRIRHLRKLKGRKSLFSQSIIHGLSGFLVMCYTRSTIVSLRLLTPVKLYGKGHKTQELVLFYNGNINYLDREHLKYAIPALFALLLITFLPPIFLLAYPLCYKVLALFRLQESPFAKLLCRVVPLEKFKPFFDSFQSTFKDRYRYFSGLYFAYRLSALALSAFTYSSTEFYFFLELQLIFMLAFHAWVYPYKKKWHNRLDLYLFILLLVLNTITIYNYQQTLNPLYIDYQYNVAVLGTFQIILAYSPLVLIIAYILMLRVRIWIKYLKEKFRRKNIQCHEISDVDFSLSLLDQRRQEMKPDTNYQKFD